MSCSLFQMLVRKYTDKLGYTVRFSFDDGRHIAEVSDGTRIIGNSTSRRVEFNWGSGHKAYGYL